jgi:hypothetical protein
MKIEHSRPASEAPSSRGASFQTLLLDRGIYGARFRLGLLLTFFTLVWFGLTLLMDFPQVLPNSIFEVLPFFPAILLDVISSFFAPDVLVYLLPILGAFLTGLHIAAAYLNDLYELGNPKIAISYLIGSVFGVRYPILTINTGEIEKLDQENPLLRIGGPGYLDLHLGFAAVFETAEGFPRIYGPSRKSELQRKVFIQGFERLRDIIDLRDQLRQIDEVPAITRDGVRVFARDVQMVFRVYGGEKRSIDLPYPYDPKSILSLVYGQVVSAEGPTRWTDTLPDLARRELQDYVAEKTLTEFLAVQPEVPKFLPQTENFPPGEISLSEERVESSRRRLIESFHNPVRQRRLRELGLELVWVGVGTWEVRDDQVADMEGEIAAATTITATARVQNKLERIRSEDHLDAEKHRSATRLTREVYHEIVDTWSNSQLPSDYRCYEMLQRLKNRFEMFRKKVFEFERTDPDGSTHYQLPDDYQTVLDHLAELTEMST